MLLFYFASVKEKHDVIERAFAYANCFQIRLYAGSDESRLQREDKEHFAA